MNTELVERLMCEATGNKFNAGKMLFGTEVDAIVKAVAEECARVAYAEHLHEPTKSADDISYDNAVNDCVDAIRAHFGIE